MRSKMKAVVWTSAVMLALGFFVPQMALAEGRCPPGQYPIGGQGVGGCAPIPSSGGADSASPRPTGRWIKTWGAIATASNGASGTVTGKLKKADAVKDALAQCSNAGASDCRISFTYKNQCVAAVIAQSGFGGTRFATAADEKLAGNVAVEDCKGAGGQGCEVIYSACSDPYFEKF